MKETIAQKILSDAKADAEATILAANQKASEIIDKANATAEDLLDDARSVVAEKTKDIADRKAALARLDSAKIVLAEKHKVLDGIYALAKQKLLKLKKAESIAFIQTLLEKYAEVGDNVCLAEGFKYEEEIKALPVVAQKQLTISESKMPIEGGVFINGKNVDKDLSIDALLAGDKEENSATIAVELFGNK